MDKFIILLLYISIIHSGQAEYFGGWPQNPDKDDINSQTVNDIICPNGIGCVCDSNDDCESRKCQAYPRGISYCVPSKGTKLPRFSLIDQFEEKVDIYDFAGHDKYILLEFSTAWCNPCHQLADWMTYNDTTIYSQRWFKKEYNTIKDMVHNNEVYFINIHFEDEWKDDATQHSTMDWFSLYPDDNIPILCDVDKVLHTLMKPMGLPVIILLNDKMEIVTYSNRGINNAFDDLMKLSR